MILPIVAIWRRHFEEQGKEITPDYPNLARLIEDMWETMLCQQRVGLAAPQINKDIRLFIVDSAQVFENQEDDEKRKVP